MQVFVEVASVAVKVGGGLDREDGRALEAVKHLAGGHDGDRSGAHFGESGGQGFGGHELAAGFTIEERNIPAFRTRMNQYVRAHTGEHRALQSRASPRASRG